MTGRIAVAAAQVADQQVAATEDIQGQEAIVVVVTVEETAFLIAVQRRVGGVEVQDQPAGRLVVGFDKLLEQHLVDRHRRLTIGPLLQPAKG